MKATIALLPGDGIGPEITQAAVEVLKGVASCWGHQFEYQEALIGGAAIDATGDPLPEKTRDVCLNADAVLLGAVGGPKWDDPNAKTRPETGLLGLRKLLDVYANIRPVKIHPKLMAASPLKINRLQGVDMIVIRELTGGIYFNEKKQTLTEATDVCTYSKFEIERVVKFAFNLAQERKHKLVSVDKANVLATSRLWRQTTEHVAKDYKDVAVENMLVDAAAMHLISKPAYFDVIVTENMFGDILTDEASMLAGSIGMLPSASLGDGKNGIYEPIHGSAPDIAGKGVANPYGTILSVALMLRYSFKLEEEALAVENAVYRVIDRGYVTPDMAFDGCQVVGTKEATRAVVEELTHSLYSLAW